MLRPQSYRMDWGEFVLEEGASAFRPKGGSTNVAKDYTYVKLVLKEE